MKPQQPLLVDQVQPSNTHLWDFAVAVKGVVETGFGNHQPSSRFSERLRLG